MSLSKVWIASKSVAWEVADVIEIKDEEITVKSSEGIVKLPRSRAFDTDPTHFDDTDDLCTMNRLHEAPLLDVLRRRFKANSIYTTTGDVVLSINPYKMIPGLYDCKTEYLSHIELGEIPRTAKPHVYKVANYAFERLRGFGTAKFSSVRNQSIVVTGESGAGKTEASKHVMNFLIGADQGSQASGADQDLMRKIGQDVAKVLLESNVIFEAFGNAKTVRNDNSSRFGKYIKLQYSEDQRIISAFTETFLLEKSRLVNISADERNYHVFYQFLKGNKNAELALQLRLASASQFKMLCDANGVANTSGEDGNYDELYEALRTLGCNEQELEHLWSLLACILHLGNITCSTNEETGKVMIESPSLPLAELTSLLGVSEMAFAMRLTTQKVKATSRSSVSMKVLTETDVFNNIQALFKWMYSCLFSWLVKKINFKHCSVSSELPNGKVVSFIGILDIFGFEILQTNSFEQLCINFTNERLQQQFNEYIFDREQEIYRSEGLDWSTISYKDNQDVIDLIGKKPTGILNILEEQGMLNRGAADENALLNAIIQTHDKVTPTFVKSRFTGDGKFIVKHFAGDVTYSVHGFLEKNNDSLQEDLMELMIGSTNPFIQNAVVSIGMSSPSVPDTPGFIGPIDPKMIVESAGNLAVAAVTTAAAAESTEVSASAAPDAAAPVPRRGRRLGGEGGGKKLATTVTVSFQFRSQLDTLLVTLRATSLHYIKCIKPNALKVPDVFDSHLVLEQLRYSGALEVVRIRQEGFPITVSFLQFYTTFEILSYGKDWIPPSECSDEIAKEYTTTLASETLAPDQFQIGHTKVFLRAQAYELMMQGIKTFYGKKVRRFQALFRGKKTLLQYRIYRRALIRLQSCAKKRLQVKKYHAKLAEIALAKQRELERLDALERKRVEAEAARIKEEKRLAEIERLKAVAKAEAERQARLAKEEAERQARLAAEEAQRVLNRRVGKLQAVVRRMLQVKRFKRMLGGVIIVQAWVRMHVKRRWFKKALIEVKKQRRILLNRRVAKLQALIRRKIPRKLFQLKRKSVVVVQSCVRMFLRRRWFLRTLADIREKERLDRLAAEEAERKAQMAREEASRLAEIEKLKEAARIAKAAAEEQARYERQARAEAARLAKEAQEEEERINKQLAEEIAAQKVIKRAQQIVLIQSFVRRKIDQRRYQTLLKGVKYLQAIVRMKPWRAWFLSTLAYNAEMARFAQEELERKVTKFQACVRRRAQLFRYRTAWWGIVYLQSYVRMKMCRRVFLEDVEVMREQIREQERLALEAAEEEARLVRLAEEEAAQIAAVLQQQEQERLEALAKEEEARRIAAEKAEAARLAQLEVERVAREKAEAERLAALAAEEEARQAHELKVQKIIKVQSIARRNSALYRYRLALNGIIFLQSYARMRPWRVWFKSTQEYNAEILRIAEEDLFLKVSRFQAVVRGRFQLFRYRRVLWGVIFLQAEVRRRITRAWYLRTLQERALAAEQAAAEAERQSKLVFEQRVQAVHLAAKAGNVSLVKLLLKANPTDYLVNDEKNRNCTVLHSAVSSGSLLLISFLNPLASEYNVADLDGNVALHHNAMGSGLLNKTKTAMFRHIVNQFEPQFCPASAASASGASSAVRAQPSRAALTTSVSFKRLSSEVESISTKLDWSVSHLVDGTSSKVLKAGWLKKRGESSSWQKRWVVLTSESLSYYTSDKDKVPRDAITFSVKNTITVNRIDAEAAASASGNATMGIDIVMKSGMTTVGKKRNRVSLMAESELEMQSWINLLKACGGVESTLTSKLRTVSPAVRQALLNITNNNGDTVLHLVCSAAHGDAPENLEAAVWLLQNGCSIATMNKQGQTPAQCANAAGNKSLVALLTIKRAPSFLENPPLLKNFHYVSLNFSRQTNSNNKLNLSASSQLYLVVSVYNDGNHLVETAQQSVCHSVDPSGVIYWLCVCPLQIPLENVGEGAFAVVEVRSSVTTAILWQTIKLDKSNIDTKCFSLSMQPPPVVVANAAPPVVNHSTSVLEVEMMITRRTGNESLVNLS